MGDKKVILVTGGSGLIGQAIQSLVTKEQQRIDERWIFLSSKDANLLNSSECKALFDMYTPTHVIHLAAMVGGILHHMRANLDFFLNNNNINLNVLHCSHQTGVKKVISCLSTCAFPDKTTYPIDETMMHNGPPHGSNFGYSYSKRMLDILNRGFAQQYGCHFTSVVLCNVFGPHDNFNLEDGHVIPGLINRAYIAQRDNTPFEIWGTGKPLRQFLYSKDLARLMLWALHDYNDIAPIMLCVDETDEISISDVALLILKAFNFQGEVKYLSDKPDGQFKKTASNKKLQNLNSGFQFTPIEQAIKETVDWFKENYEIARK